MKSTYVTNNPQPQSLLPTTLEQQQAHSRPSKLNNLVLTGLEKKIKTSTLNNTTLECNHMRQQQSSATKLLVGKLGSPYMPKRLGRQIWELILFLQVCTACKQLQTTKHKSKTHIRYQWSPSTNLTI